MKKNPQALDLEDKNSPIPWISKHYYHPSPSPDVLFSPSLLHTVLSDLYAFYENEEVRYKEIIMKQIITLRQIVTTQTHNVLRCERWVGEGKRIMYVNRYMLLRGCKGVRLYQTLEWEFNERVRVERVRVKVVKGLDYMGVAGNMVRCGMKPCVVVAAHPCSIGGDFEKDGKEYNDGIEDDVYRRSSLFYSMEDIGKCRNENSTWYNIPQYGCIYAPDILLMRSPESEGYAFIEDPVECSFILTAPLTKPKCKVIDPRDFVGYDKNKLHGQKQLEQTYAEKLMGKIKSSLTLAKQRGHKSVIFAGPLGTYRCPPFHAAVIYRHIIMNEFCDCFEEIVFCIRENQNAKFPQSYDPFNYVFNHSHDAEYKQFAIPKSDHFFKGDKISKESSDERFISNEIFEKFSYQDALYKKNNQMHWRHEEKLKKENRPKSFYGSWGNREKENQRYRNHMTKESDDDDVRERIDKERKRQIEKERKREVRAEERMKQRDKESKDKYLENVIKSEKKMYVGAWKSGSVFNNKKQEKFKKVTFCKGPKPPLYQNKLHNYHNRSKNINDDEEEKKLRDIEDYQKNYRKKEKSKYSSSNTQQNNRNSNFRNQQKEGNMNKKKTRDNYSIHEEERPPNTRSSYSSYRTQKGEDDDKKRVEKQRDEPKHWNDRSRNSNYSERKSIDRNERKIGYRDSNGRKSFDRNEGKTSNRDFNDRMNIDNNERRTYYDYKERKSNDGNERKNGYRDSNGRKSFDRNEREIGYRDSNGRKNFDRNEGKTSNRDFYDRKNIDNNERKTYYDYKERKSIDRNERKNVYRDYYERKSIDRNERKTDYNDYKERKSFDRNADYREYKERKSVNDRKNEYRSNDKIIFDRNDRRTYERFKERDTNNVSYESNKRKKSRPNPSRSTYESYKKHSTSEKPKPKNENHTPIANRTPREIQQFLLKQIRIQKNHIDVLVKGYLDLKGRVERMEKDFKR